MAEVNIDVQFRTTCKYCKKGTENECGDIWFAHFPFKNNTCIYHETPVILKRNGRYFMYLANHLPLEIKACPICGRELRRDKDDC